MERTQRLEKEHSELFARIEGEAALRRIAVEVAEAARAAPLLGDRSKASRRQCVARSSAGAREGSRARQASRLHERWSDGRYMTHAEWEQIEREAAADYLRYAAGGFARASNASRFPDGTFGPK